MTALHTESLRQRRTEVIQFLASRSTGSATSTTTGPQAPGAASPAPSPSDDSQPTSTVWLIYEGPDGLEYAITKEDYDDAREWIWPADCPNPDPPIKMDKSKSAVQKRWVAIPAGEYPTCWVAPVYLEDGTMFTREREKESEAVA